MKGMPLIVGRDLNSSTDAYGHRSTFWPLTLSSNAMLPTEGTIDTVVCACASWSCTMSPFWRAAYCCANAGVTDASAPAMVNTSNGFQTVARICLPRDSISNSRRNSKGSKSDPKSDRQCDLRSDRQSDPRSDPRSNRQSDLRSDRKSDPKSDRQSDPKSDRQSDPKSDLQSDLTPSLTSSLTRSHAASQSAPRTPRRGA